MIISIIITLLVNNCNFHQQTVEVADKHQNYDLPDDMEAPPLKITASSKMRFVTGLGVGETTIWSAMSRHFAKNTHLFFGKYTFFTKIEAALNKRPPTVCCRSVGLVEPRKTAFWTKKGVIKM
jgi:hypothetical protein